MRNLFTMSLAILSVVACSEGFGGGMRAGGWNGGGSGGGRGAKFGSAPAKTYFGAGAGPPVGSNSKNTTGKVLPSRRGLGISAWGIIAIIISAIMLVAGIYYFFIFYPLICKKERNYDVMELHQSPV